VLHGGLPICANPGTGLAGLERNRLRAAGVLPLQKLAFTSALLILQDLWFQQLAGRAEGPSQHSNLLLVKGVLNQAERNI
jgi:hypothetical protein